MKKIIILIMLLNLLPCAFTLADGMMIPDKPTWLRNRERSMINEPEQKAVVFFSKGKEQLIISPSYEGPTSSFAWVVPVPSKPSVEIVKGAIFHELMRLTTPRPRAIRKSASGNILCAAAGVTVIERKTIGAYDVSVLSANDGNALMKWLRVNKYHLPDNAVGPIKSYVKQGWTFVASRIKVQESAQGLHSGTLAPLKLTFRVKKPIYPMKLSSANPKYFNILVYLIVPSTEIEWQQRSIPVIGSTEYSANYESAMLRAGQKRYPTLARLSSAELHIFKLASLIQPRQCKQDIRWVLSSK